MTHFHCAIRKCRHENFTFSILEVGENAEYGKNAAEPQYIEWLKPAYNKTKGGDGTVGVIFPESWKRAQSLRNIGNTHALGSRYTRSATDKQNISKRMRGFVNQKVTCPHCGVMGGKNCMDRWHFNNCKKVTP